MQSRRLVRYGLVDADIFRIEASDRTVLLRHVERDEHAKPMRGQIDRWLNLLWAAPGMDAVFTDTGAPSRNCSQSPETRVDSRSGRTDKCAKIWTAHFVTGSPKTVPTRKAKSRVTTMSRDRFRPTADGSPFQAIKR